jgi:hypothetical protein
MVGASGFEPLTTRTPSVCATRLRYAPTAGFGLAECNIRVDLNQFNELDVVLKTLLAGRSKRSQRRGAREIGL